MTTVSATVQNAVPVLRRSRGLAAFQIFLALGLVQIGCLQLLPSPYQDIGPVLSSVLGTTTAPKVKTYLIVGNAGTVLHSSNGTTWTAQTFPNTNAIHAVAWNGSRFIAVGAGSGSGQAARAYHSTDGKSWTEVITPCPGGTGAGALFDIAFSGTRTMAFGQTGAPGYCAVYSDDNGVTWRAATVPGGSSYRGGAYTGSAFVTQGDTTYTHRSTTGTSFTANGTTPLNGAGSYSDLFWHAASSTLLVFGDGGGKAQAACHSTNGGVSFGTCQNIFGANGSSQSPQAMAASTTRIVAVGSPNGAQCRLDFTENFTTFAWQSPEIYISAACPGIQLNGIVHDGSKFITVGAGGNIGVSSTGGQNDWTFTTQGTQNLNAIMYVEK